MNRKYLSLILAMIMVVSTFSIVNAAPTNNIKIDWLVKNGIVKGDSGTGDLRLMESITRSEAATMIVRAQQLETLVKGFEPIVGKFKDVKTSHWANGYINVAVSNGVVNGYPDGTFKPEGKITYEEIIKMLVVVNGDLPAENKLDSWEVPYIQKAIEVGILKDINIDSYKAPAIRSIMFEMVYNVVSKDSVTGLESYKGIVIENSRVNGLDKDEIAIEVLERNSSAANHRYDKESNVRIKLGNVKGDTNYLLGKVIDVTINDKNEATILSVDNSYSYLTGAANVLKDRLTIKGKTYNVSDTNIYANTFDKLLAIYHNDKSYNDFKEYFEKIGKSKEFNIDFSNVTMKGNSILFIDSFVFEDIAPVKETLKSGEEIHIFRDDSNGTITRFIPNSVLAFTQEGIKSMEIEDIKANDVVHIYNREKAIVRTDAKVTGSFGRFNEDSKGNYVQLDGKDYLVSEADKRKSIYSLDGIRYFTIFGNRGFNDLAPLKDKNVSLLLDANNKVQAIVGEIKFNEGVFVIDETTRKDANVLGINNESITALPDSSSILNFLGSKDNKYIDDFKRGDLVYLMNDNNNKIDKMIRMATAATINTQAKPVVKTAKGNFDMSKSSIRLEEARNLTSTFLINNANVFIIEVDGSKVPKIQGTTLDYVIENTKSNSNLKAYIITNRDFNIMNVGNDIKVGNEAEIAHTIIFTNLENIKSDLIKEVIQVTFKFIPGKDSRIEGNDIYGSTITRDVEKYANIPTLVAGDIIQLSINKDKFVEEVVVSIPKSDKTYKVIALDDYSSTIARLAILEDSNKVRKQFYILKDAFDLGQVKIGDIVSVNLNKSGDIDILVVRDSKTSISGKF